MVYVTSPYAPRADVKQLKQGLSNTEAARRSGVNRSTIGKWLRKAKNLELHYSAYVPTLISLFRGVLFEHILPCLLMSIDFHMGL